MKKWADEQMLLYCTYTLHTVGFSFCLTVHYIIYTMEHVYIETIYWVGGCKCRWFKIIIGFNFLWFRRQFHFLNITEELGLHGRQTFWCHKWILIWAEAKLTPRGWDGLRSDLTTDHWNDIEIPFAGYYQKGRFC